MWSLLLGCQYYGDQVSFELPNTAREILNFGTLQFLTCPDYSQHWEFTIVDLHGRGNPHWMWHAVFSFWSWHSSHWSCLHCQIGKDGGRYNPNLLIFFLRCFSSCWKSLPGNLPDSSGGEHPEVRLKGAAASGPSCHQRLAMARPQLRWPMAWMTWCDPTRSTVSTWKSPKWRLYYGKIIDDQKKLIDKVAKFDSERYLSWWSTFLGLLEVWGGTADVDFAAKKPQLNLARPWLQCGKRPMYKNARVETEQHGSKCLCGADWAEGWLLVVGITSPWVLRWWLACAASPRVFKLMTWSPSGTPARALSFFVANKNYQTCTVADFKYSNSLVMFFSLELGFHFFARSTSFCSCTNAFSPCRRLGLTGRCSPGGKFLGFS